MSIEYESNAASGRIANRTFDKSWYKLALTLLQRNNLISNEDLKFIDWGSSACEFIELIRDNYNLNCIAADYPALAVDYANHLGYQSFQLDANDARSLPAQYHNYADIVTSLEQMEHVTDLDSYFHIIHKALTVDGCFLFSTPNSSSLSQWINYMYYGAPVNEGHHYRFLNRQKLHFLIILNGFDIIDEEHQCSNHFGIQMAESFVNTALNITRPIAQSIARTKEFRKGFKYKLDLQIDRWCFLLRKDSLFEPINYLNNIEGVEQETAGYMIDKMDRLLLKRGYMSDQYLMNLKAKLIN